MLANRYRLATDDCGFLAHKRAGGSQDTSILISVPRVNSNLKRQTIFLMAICLMATAACSSVPGPDRASLPDQRKVTRDSLVFHTNFYFPRRHRLVEELLAKRSDIESTLGLSPSDETIHIFLFEDQQKFRQFLHERHPSFPDRRAFFLQSSTNLLVYAHWNSRVAEDLRHEVTHAYVHSVIPDVPLWLDEGIAEYFEMPTSERGLNETHLEYLAAEHKSGRWQPDLERLESLQEAGEMSQLDYAESWLWIHFMIHHSDRTGGLLQSYLQQRQYDQLSKDEKLLPQLLQLDENVSTTLVDHLKSLASPYKLVSVGAKE